MDIANIQVCFKNLYESPSQNFVFRYVYIYVYVCEILINLTIEILRLH